MYAFIYNTRPTASGVKITPQWPSSTEDMTVDYTFQDDDQFDTELGTVFRWYMRSGADLELRYTTNIPVLNHTRFNKSGSASFAG